MHKRVLYTPKKQLRRKAPLSRKKVWGALFVTLVAAVFGGLWYVSNIPSWQIQTVRVSGGEEALTDLVRAHVYESFKNPFAFVFPRSNFLLVSERTLVQNILRDFSRIERVVVTKNFPDTLLVEVEPREFWALLCTEEQTIVSPLKLGLATTTDEEAAFVPLDEVPGSCVYLDASGFAYDNAPRFSGSLLFTIESDQDDIEVGEYLLDDELIGLIQRFRKTLSEDAIGERLVGFRISTEVPDEVRMSTASGFDLYVNRTDDFERVFMVLETVLREEIKGERLRVEYIDLRFGSKVFYKLRE